MPERINLTMKKLDKMQSKQHTFTDEMDFGL